MDGCAGDSCPLSLVQARASAAVSVETYVTKGFRVPIRGDTVKTAGKPKGLANFEVARDTRPQTFRDLRKTAVGGPVGPGRWLPTRGRQTEATSNPQGKGEIRGFDRSRFAFLK